MSVQDLLPDSSSSTRPTVTGFSDLFESGLLADCTVKCGSKTWKAHKAILCTRSSYFRAALLGNFQEARNSEVSFDKHDPVCVEHALRYIYSGSLDDIARNWNNHYISAPDDLSVFRLLISLYLFADYIGLDTLRLDIVGALHLITKKMAHIIRLGGDSGDGRWWMMDGSALALTQCAEQAYSLEVYDRTLSSIRAPVVELLIVLKGTIWGNKPLISSLRDIPDLLPDFFAAVGEHSQAVGGLMLPSESRCRASHRCRHCALNNILMEDVCAQCARVVKRYLTWLLYTWGEVEEA